jgi:hypothetical protein
VNHLAAAIAHGHRRIDQRYLDFDFGFRVLGRLLDFNAGFRREWTHRCLRAGGSASQSQKKSQSQGCAADSGHSRYQV